MSFGFDNAYHRAAGTFLVERASTMLLDPGGIRDVQGVGLDDLLEPKGLHAMCKSRLARFARDIYPPYCKLISSFLYLTEDPCEHLIRSAEIPQSHHAAFIAGAHCHGLLPWHCLSYGHLE